VALARLRPAEEIAIALSRLTGAPLERCLARRAGLASGPPAGARLADPPQVSSATADPGPPCWSTTSAPRAPLAACAAALRSGGARSVAAVVLARAG
jgi:hypothetical protein